MDNTMKAKEYTVLRKETAIGMLMILHLCISFQECSRAPFFHQYLCLRLGPKGLTDSKWDGGKSWWLPCHFLGIWALCERGVITIWVWIYYYISDVGPWNHAASIVIPRNLLADIPTSRLPHFLLSSLDWKSLCKTTHLSQEKLESYVINFTFALLN